MKFRIFLVAGLLCAVSGGSAVGDVIVSGFAIDDLSNASGVVSVDVDNQDSRSNVVVGNTTTGESYQFDISGTLNGATGTNAQLNETGDDNNFALNSLGVNDLTNSSDVTTAFDARSGNREGVLFTFDTALTLNAVHFDSIQWDDSDDYETVEVYRNGVLTNTLFSEDVNTLDTSFTGATGAIVADSDDDFGGLGWAFGVGDTVEFRMNGTPLTGTGSQTGYRLEQLTFASIPEPSSLAMLGLGAIGFVVRRRR